MKSHLKLKTALSGEFVVSITDVLGKKFIEEPMHMDVDKETRIDLSTIPPGVYFLKVFQSDNLVLARKIIKE